MRCLGFGASNLGLPGSEIWGLGFGDFGFFLSRV